MGARDLLSRFPEELAIGTQQTGSYFVVPDHVAFRGPLPEQLVASRVGRLEAEDLTICHDAGDLGEEKWAAPVTAVYRRSTGSSFAVPTGEVFARLVKGARVADHTSAFEEAGYEVARTLFYAPNAAWLRASSGDVADALRRIPVLEALPEVENVEPQMLSPRALR